MNKIKEFLVNQYYSRHFLILNSLRKQIVGAFKTSFSINRKVKEDLTDILSCDSKTRVYSQIIDILKEGRYNTHQLMYIVNHALRIKDSDIYGEICLYQLQIALIVKEYNTYGLLKFSHAIHKVFELLNDKVIAHNLLELILDSVIEFFENKDIPMNEKVAMGYMFYNLQKDKGNILDNTTSNFFNYIGVMSRMFKIMDLIREVGEKVVNTNSSLSPADQEINSQDQDIESTNESIGASGMEDMLQRFHDSSFKKDFKYSGQISAIKDCLTETYGENIQYIKITNKFLEIIEALIDGKHTGENYGALRYNLSEYFVQYGSELYDKIEKEISLENPNLNEEKISRETSKRIFKIEQKFVELLLERIEYMPNKK